MFAVSNVWREKGRNETARRWLIEAAGKGHLDAMNAYGAFLKEGGLGFQARTEVSSRDSAEPPL